MDFLTPIFGIAGLVAGSIPIVLHMLRRAPTQEMPFSLVRFLKPSQPRLTKRSSIEHWPLMLLRILALILIGLAFARPFQREVVGLETQGDAVRSVTILIDASASMRRNGLRAQVIEKIREVAEQLNDQDLLNVVEFSDVPRQVLSREAWQAATASERAALLDAVIADYEPDWMNTATGVALRMAADDLAQEQRSGQKIEQRQLVLITDFQRGSQLDELKSGGWPAGVELDLKIVSPDKPGNVGITYLADRRSDRIRVRVASAADSRQQDVQLQPFDAAGQPVGPAIPLRIAPGQRRSVLLPAADAAERRIVAGVELLDDDHPFDNVVDLPELENPIVRVAHIGPAQANDAESMRYYVQRVFAGNVERDIQLVDLLTDNGPPLPVPSDVQLLIATDAVPDSLLDSVQQLFDRSGTLLMAAPDAAAVQSVAGLLPASFEVREADVDDYAMLGQIDFDHPLFAAFRDARFSDFSSIRFWRYRNLQFSEEDRQPGDWSIIARFDNGLPALADVAVGESGTLLLLASGWHPTDSQLALSTRFPALLTRTLSLASPPQRQQLIRTVGETIVPQDIAGTSEWKLVLPDGTERTADDLSAEDSSSVGLKQPAIAESSSDDGAYRTTTWQLREPGRYTIIDPDSDAGKSISLIAGLDPAETRTESLPAGQLQILGVGTASDPGPTSDGEDNFQSSAGQLSRNELENRQQLWRWLLLAGLMLLFTESLWAAAIQRRQQPVSG